MAWSPYRLAPRLEDDYSSQPVTEGTGFGRRSVAMKTECVR